MLVIIIVVIVLVVIVISRSRSNSSSSLVAGRRGPAPLLPHPAAGGPAGGYLLVYVARDIPDKKFKHQCSKPLTTK